MKHTMMTTRYLLPAATENYYLNPFYFSFQVVDVNSNYFYSIFDKMQLIFKQNLHL